MKGNKNVYNTEKILDSLIDNISEIEEVKSIGISGTKTPLPRKGEGDIRKDVLFYHFAIDIALDHFLQATFALNRTYFPSRKRTLSFVNNFNIKPERCGEKLLEVVRLGACPESISDSYKLWSKMVTELNKLYKD